MWQYVCVLLYAAAVVAQSSGEYRVVNITQGPVRGRFEPEDGVYAFYNIPYATAPTGRNRFKAPLDPPVWMHTFDAVHRGIVCPQDPKFILPGNNNMQEDCLIANVFVPDTDARNLSVLVSVHGGAFLLGSGNSDRFTDLTRTKKLIVVSFNYRLGTHGFLCLGTEAVPGNAGLKDQVALLRWVKKNIASFGGNPEDVTITGCSAGGGSVDLLTLTKATKGLFNKAIVGSGAALGYVGLQVDPIANAQNYAKDLNFSNVNDLKALEEFYLTAPLQLISKQVALLMDNPDSKITVAPCVERDVGEERIFDEAPTDIIKQGKYNKVPLMYGFANMEGMYRIHVFNSWKDKMNERFADFLPGELYFESEQEKAEVGKTVKEFYFGTQPVSENNVLSYIDFFTDVLFAYPMLKNVKDRVESLNDTIYLFEYSFVDKNTMSIPHTNVTGAPHCFQTHPVIDAGGPDLTPEFLQMRSIMQGYWLNFILSGSPWAEGSQLVRWPPANANRSPHLSIGTTIQLKGVVLQDRITLWDGIYDKYYRAPSPPGSSGLKLIVSNILLIFVLLNVILF